MNDRSTSFEDQLKQLAPSACDELISETFYKAGWEACAASKAAAVPSSPKHTASSAKLFCTGLACGLMCAVGAFLWAPMNSEGTSSINVGAIGVRSAPQSLAVQTAAMESEADLPDLPPMDIAWNDLWADLLPWNAGPSNIPDEFEPRATQALSPAARHYWSSVVLADPGFALPAADSLMSDEVKTRRTPLRSFPATGRVLDELL